MNILLRIIALSLLLSGGLAEAQVISRSGFPAPQESRQVKRPLPCTSRDILFEEQFSSSTLPTGWTALSRDTAELNPAIDTLYQDNWQPIIDFKDENNGAVASPSWHKFEDRYTPVDNWLISPEVTLGNNTCLSWVAYSQDRFFPESYEVLISPSGSPDLVSFTDTITVVESEGFFLLYRSANLAAYAGQTVRLAFRHTSVQNFILVLDDIRLAEVEDIDVGIVGLISPQPYDTVSYDSMRLTVVLQNFGSDTVTLDSVQIGFSDQNQTIAEDAIVRFDTSVKTLAPNDTIWVRHPEYWNPNSDSAAFDLRVWSKLDGDGFAANDTMYRRMGVGTNITSVDDKLFTSLSVYPNPTDNILNIAGDFTQQSTARLYTISGKMIFPPVEIQPGSQKVVMNLSSLPGGMYFLQITGKSGAILSRKVVVE